MPGLRNKCQQESLASPHLTFNGPTAFRSGYITFGSRLIQNTVYEDEECNSLGINILKITDALIKSSPDTPGDNNVNFMKTGATQTAESVWQVLLTIQAKCNGYLSRIARSRQSRYKKYDTSFALIPEHLTMAWGWTWWNGLYQQQAGRYGDNSVFISWLSVKH